MAALLVALSCVSGDQASKRVAAELLKGGAPRSFLGDAFRLIYVENSGAFLGFGADWPEPVRGLFFTGSALLVIAVSLVWVWRQLRNPHCNTLAVLAMVLVAAGGAGNLLDRVVRDGRVIDFMNFGLGSVRTGIFNVADVQIMLGLVLFLIARRTVGAGSDQSLPARPSKESA